MAPNKADLIAGNIAIVQSQDSTCLESSEVDIQELLGLNETVTLPIVQSKCIDQDIQIEGLYKSRLIPFPSPQESNDVKKFRELKSQWETDTAILSSDIEIAIHPAYQEIIGMGEDVIPLILSEMGKKPGNWFWALKSITGEDPILPEHRGKVEEMTKMWLNWGREKGYI
jgi:hypothetical protein